MTGTTCDAPLALSNAAVQQLGHCNKCGFCLPACPTYIETGLEVHSPRGRLSLMEAAWRGELSVDQGLADALSLCIGCRACETACPSGVHYSTVLEAARTDMVRRRRRWVIPAPAAPALLRLVRHRRVFRAAVRLGRAARRLPLPASLTPLTAMLPARVDTPRAGAAPRASRSGPAVHFVDTCVMAAMFPTANRDAVILLSAAGAHLVGAPKSEGCCGALEAHVGHLETARQLARTQVARWERHLAPDTWLVAHSGGCAAMMADYGRLLGDDERWREPARHWAAQVRDFATALAALPSSLRFRGTGARVALQNSCHLVNGLHQGGAPATLLAGIPGDQFIPLAGQDRCCGAGGVYNLNQPAMARQVLARHLAEGERAAVNVWLVNNPGCALHLEQGVQALGGRARVQHLATYLRERWVDKAPQDFSQEG
ncbi:MAG: (Fe-S)-binding protein [Thermaerobacter sp.]|nr:(Fe-S)-binding protein [Thermaerobacter sp.]